MMRLKSMLGAAAAFCAPSMALAQHDAGAHEHHVKHPQPPEPAKPASHEGHEGMSMDGMDGPMPGHSGALGPYAMTRDASGTAWQPQSSPHEGVMGRAGDWSLMAHGFATLVHDDQGGPRGDEKTFSSSMLMGMASRPLGGGTLSLRAMGSLDPLMGRSGYPLLLATGETADGSTELVDRQHPHDLFMELSATYSRPIAGELSGFVYIGLPGEPALGPAAFMHRSSGAASPEAPIAHHWLDSTHVTFGVATAGLVYDGLKIEASLFTGREPDEHRYDIERPRFDSWSVRATWNPTDNLSLQGSYGVLNSPEALHPDEDVRRTTASIAYNVPFASGNWQSTAAWGRNNPSSGASSDAFLLESALEYRCVTAFGRIENVDKDELFADGDPLHGRMFNVTKVSFGGYRSFPVGDFALDLGGLVSKYGVPNAIEPAYGENPTSFMLFARFRIVG
jgi:hypothetical protein